MTSKLVAIAIGIIYFLLGLYISYQLTLLTHRVGLLTNLLEEYTIVIENQ